MNNTTTDKQSFTPGPWTTTGSLIFKQKNPGGKKWYIADCSMDLGAQATIANARLIAAAPDLLEACRAFVATRTNPELTHAVKLAEAAIAKAEP